MQEKRHTCCKFTIIEEKQIIQEYQSGFSMASLGKKWGCSLSTIQNVLKAYQIPARTLSQARRNFLKETLNEGIFEKIDTPDKAYWLGVMYSDGYISKTSLYTNYFGLSVSSRDKEWLLKFKHFLNYNGNIHDYKVVSGYKPNTPYSRLLIGSNHIVECLEKWGVVEHKTKIINKMPNINFKDDFIRGYIDGDGSLSKKHPRLTICGNKNFLIDIAEYFGIKYNIYPDKSIFDLQYNKQESEYLEKRLYKNALTFLDRKYNIAKRSFNSPLTLEDVKENSLD
nr:MAG TPA: homing endonuclease [Herelleviridae sp.]